MGNYWAIFEEINGNIFRFDTRIYLKEITQPHSTDICIGAIVGKNPGSAQAQDLRNHELQKIELNKDKLLPNIRSIIEKAYKKADKNIEANYYVQVLNLFYLCDPNLNYAIEKIRNYETPKICNSETSQFPWVWYMWGRKSKIPSEFQDRGTHLNTNKHFFFDKNLDSVREGVPTVEYLAKHIQGLKHGKMIPYLTHII